MFMHLLFKELHFLRTEPFDHASQKHNVAYSHIHSSAYSPDFAVVRSFWKETTTSDWQNNTFKFEKKILEK